jgi:hypothetical protein
MGWGRLCIERRPNRSGDATAQVEVLEGEAGHHEHCRICAEASRCASNHVKTWRGSIGAAKQDSGGSASARC